MHYEDTTVVTLKRGMRKGGVFIIDLEVPLVLDCTGLYYCMYCDNRDGVNEY
jgi:hypothetical protein